MNMPRDGTASVGTRVLIVDDHYIMRRGLTELLGQQSNLTVGAAVSDAEDALDIARHEHFDLAIIDISLGRTNGIELTDRLKTEHPELIVLILSMYEEEQYADCALHAGASGFVAKQRAGEILLGAIHQVLRGEQYFSHTSKRPG